MSVVIKYMQDLLYKKHDPRTADWFLISPGSIFTVCVVYLYFSLSAGPKYMRDKKPYDLKKTLIIYNFAQVVASAWLFCEGLLAGWGNDYSFTCQPVDYSDNPKVMRMVRAVYLYYLLKIIELVDTVFFVLRKKQRQISTLHVYHHSLMPICSWIGVRYMPNGHPTFLGLINTFIHIIMYGYYMLSALGPQVGQYLWWKRYLTIMQIIQFFMVFIHNAQIFFNGCPFPKILAALIMINSIIFVYMFSSFYVKTYMQQKRKTRENESLTNGAVKEAVANGVCRGKLD